MEFLVERSPVAPGFRCHVGLSFLNVDGVSLLAQHSGTPLGSRLDE
jgi:hypothetical protein